MHYNSFRRLLRALSPMQRRGPVALVLIQDDLGLAETVAHYHRAGITCVIGLGPADAPAADFTHSAPFACHQPNAMVVAANALMAAIPGAWIIPCWNGERLFWPHGDTRPLPDLFAFLEDERRDVLCGVVVDAFPGTDSPWKIDAMGYFQRGDRIHGGLRDRIGAPCPAAARPLDRPLAVKSRKGLRFHTDGTLNDPALNSLHHTWHHCPTGALISPRVWAWLAAQGDHDSQTLKLEWPGCVGFKGRSAELWELGFLEPGQWV